MDLSSKKHQPELEENQATSKQLGKQADDPKDEDEKNYKEEEEQNNVNSPAHSKDKRDCKRHAGVTSDSNLLFRQFALDISIHCLLRLSRSDYGSIAALNKSFRSLVRSGELYELRRKARIIEHWIYFSCEETLQWEAFDPNRGRLMHLPTLVYDESFKLSDKESLAVGTELLLFGKEFMAPTIYKYSLLTNVWSAEKNLNTPRYLFGSASLGEIAILAGGFDPCGNILSSAELYNSKTGKWQILPNMNKPRQRCSGVFMDGKFYVIGGIGVDGTRLTCGEEFDMEKKQWRVIPDMFPIRSGVFESPLSIGSPPLIAVVKNMLYAADYAQQELKKYDKENNSWVTIGRFPEQATSLNGWGLAFKACGDMLVFVGGPILDCGSMVEINGWIPNDGAPQWNRLATMQSGSFVHNCTVMGC